MNVRIIEEVVLTEHTQILLRIKYNFCLTQRSCGLRSVEFWSAEKLGSLIQNPLEARVHALLIVLLYPVQAEPFNGQIPIKLSYQIHE